MTASRTRLTAVAAVVAGTWTVGWAATSAQHVAQANPTTSQAAPSTTPAANRAAPGIDMRASTLIGRDVRNAQGQDLGEIQDLIVDVNNQRVHYAVLAFGGLMGLGEKLFAYPVRLLTPSGDALVLNVSKQQLERAPGFERNRWPDWADNRYRGQVDRYFGPTVALQPRENMQLVRASHLIGRDVDDRRGQDAGEIEDIVVNLGNASIHYVVLDFDKAWSPDDKMVSLPMNALRVPADRDDDLVLNVPRENIDTSDGFDDNAWPDLNDPIYQQQIDRQLPTYRPWTHSPNQVLGADPATGTRP